MQIWYHNRLDSQRWQMQVAGDLVRIGRDADNDIVLDSPFVAPTAAILERRTGRWRLHPQGNLNTWKVDDVEVRRGECAELVSGSRIEHFPFEFSVKWEDESAGATHIAETGDRILDTHMSQLIRAIHVVLLAKMDLKPDEDRRNHPEYLLTLENNIEAIAQSDEAARECSVRFLSNPALQGHIAGHAVRQGILQRLVERSGHRGAWAARDDEHWSCLASAVPDREQDLAMVVDRMFNALRLRPSGDLSEQIDIVTTDFWSQWETVRRDLFVELILYIALRELKKQIKDIVFGYGPLEDLLRLPTITEIMVVDSDHIYIERNGLLENSGRRFVSDDVTLTIIQRIVGQVGRRIDKAQPLVDARLSDGSRVNAVIPPLAVSGPCLTIRKFPIERLTIEDLIDMGTMTRTVAEFLRAAVVAKQNILISGGTGTGKTTLLNCLSEFIPLKERIVTIEDTAELRLNREHVVRMETKPSNVEGAGAYTIQDLVRNSLRMRPDRIIVGECRGPEALDMLQAMNTGHDGSLTTLHANSPKDVQLRLEVLVRTGTELPVDSIQRQIASAIDLVVQLARMRDGSRRVSHVTEIVGLDDRLGGLLMKDLYRLTGSDLRLMPTGHLPNFMGKLIANGLLDLESFYL